MDAWPFLVSRNRSLDYRAVVAPDFLVRAGRAQILAVAATGDPTAPDHIFARQIRDADVGDVTLVFQVVTAREGGEVLTDGFGREIEWVEGVVLKGREDDASVTRADLEEAHRRLEGP